MGHRKREPLIPVAKNISKTIKKLYEFHFHKRAEVEKNFSMNQAN